MLEHVKTFKFEDMQHHHGGRSRAPILCVSGFLSEADNPMKEWRQMIEGFPFTEMYSLNWESFSILRTFVQSIKCLRGVSFRSLTKMWLRAFESILPANDGMHGGDPYKEEAG